MAELTAIGPEPHQRWQKSIPPGETICLGRAPRQGWRVPWDIMISREHAQLVWESGSLTVRCLETARNPVIFRDRPTKDFQAGVGETFRIGATRFMVSEPVDPSTSSEVLEERSYGAGELRNIAFSEPARQLELITRVPELIRSSRTDEDLAVKLVSLLLEAFPRAEVAAVVRFDDLAKVANGQPAMMRWDSRKDRFDRFVPSRRLMEKALVDGKSVVHLWTNLGSGVDAANYTVYGNLDWAICTPLTNEACQGWCLYVSGNAPQGATVEKLKPDLRFTELIAEFIESIRQVRQLEKMQAGMSQFFSPTVLETLNAEKAGLLLQPREGDITVIFCDVRGFSRMAQDDQQNMLKLLERVSGALGVMTRGIVKYDGIIADFQGDAALGFWGWPVALVDGPLPACAAALDIQAEFLAASRQSDHLLADFRIGIGIAHGRAVAGKIGSDQQAKVGVFGHVVNLGARLEGMTRRLGVPILVDEATAALIREAAAQGGPRVRHLGRFQPYGLDADFAVFELLPPESEAANQPAGQIAQFESAVDLFTAGNWPEARRLLATLPEADGARSFLLNWIDHHGGTPPEEWTGVIRLEGK